MKKNAEILELKHTVTELKKSIVSKIDFTIQKKESAIQRIGQWKLPGVAKRKKKNEKE